jgi:hypothetical protein
MRARRGGSVARGDDADSRSRVWDPPTALRAVAPPDEREGDPTATTKYGGILGLLTQDTRRGYVFVHSPVPSPQGEGYPTRPGG